MSVERRENEAVRYLEDLALVARREVVVLDVYELLVIEELERPLGQTMARLLRRDLRIPPSLVHEPKVASGPGLSLVRQMECLRTHLGLQERSRVRDIVYWEVT
jgi:hypothetical protein